jgi:hypothetical protein
MAVLSTVSEYVAQARAELQDLVSPYRYSDALLVMGLNLALSEVARLRPDILTDATYRGQINRSYTVSRVSIPMLSSSAMDDVVPMPEQYRTALLYYIVGRAQIIDNEDTQDERATRLLNKFIAQLLSVQS